MVVLGAATNVEDRRALTLLVRGRLHPDDLDVILWNNRLLRVTLRQRRNSAFDLKDTSLKRILRRVEVDEQTVPPQLDIWPACVPEPVIIAPLANKVPRSVEVGEIRRPGVAWYEFAKAGDVGFDRIYLLSAYPLARYATAYAVIREGRRTCHRVALLELRRRSSPLPPPRYPLHLKPLPLPRPPRNIPRNVRAKLLLSQALEVRVLEPP